MKAGVTYTFDPVKAAKNLAKHGVDFNVVTAFEWDDAKIVADTRYDYDEDRFVAYSYIGSALHVLVFTPRGETCRVISLRKANNREIKAYEKA